MTEETTFDSIIKTSNAISLVHYFVDHFIGKYDEEKFRAISVIGYDGKVLAQAAASGCSDHLLHIANVQAKQAIRGTEVRCVDRSNGNGPIKGHFGSVALKGKKMYVGFYVRNMTADDAAEIIQQVSLKSD